MKFIGEIVARKMEQLKKKGQQSLANLASAQTTLWFDTKYVIEAEQKIFLTDGSILYFILYTICAFKVVCNNELYERPHIGRN